MFSSKFLLFCCSIIQLWTCGLCDSTSEKIYADITGHQSCFRLLNGTHQVGCASKQGGNVGILHYIETGADVDWVINTGPHEPYVVLMTPHTFNRDYVMDLKASGKVNGILLINYNDTDLPTEGFSPDDTCPNRRSSFYQDDVTYKDCGDMQWNAAGTAMMFEDYGFPIMTLSEKSEVEFIINNCYKRFNEPMNDTAREYPLCAAELKDDMYAAKDTPTCIRRSNLVLNLNPERYCDPIGDLNIHVLSKPLNNTGATLENNTIIVAATKMDGFSMFDSVYNNTEGTVTGVVTLLAAAQIWGQFKESLPEDHNPVMFTFFQGESFDYIGSGRMVYDMARNEFPAAMSPDEPGPHPISFQHLKAMLEISQVGMSDSGTIWAHSDPITGSDPAVQHEVDMLEEALRNQSTSAGVTVESTASGQPLPPASLQSFLKETSLPGVVISDNDTTFSNRYYNSRLDLPGQIEANYPPDMNSTEEMYNHVTPAAARLAKVATLVARSLYQLSTNMEPPSDMVVNDTVVANLLYCFTKSARCELFYQVVHPDDIEVLNQMQGIYKWYVSVSRIENHVTKLVHRIMAYYTGEHLPNITDSDDCKALDSYSEADRLLYSYVWMAGPRINGSRLGMCMKTTAKKTHAKSPAFDIEDYDWASGQYSTWTESSWDVMSVRVFLKPSPTREVYIMDLHDICNTWSRGLGWLT